jgi:ABC-type amino acid transport substrate-binding protein
MSGWPPFMSINPQGEFEGFDVDVAQNIAQQLGKKIIIKDFESLSPLFLALEQGKIDMVFSGLDITNERLQKMEMVSYYGETITFMKLLFWKSIPAQITKIEDIATLKNPIIIFEPASGIAEKYVNRLVEQYPAIIAKPIDTLGTAVLEVQYGKSLAMLLEPLVAQRLLIKNPELKVLEIPLPKDLYVYGCGIAIKKNNSILRDSVASVIKQIQENGILRKFVQKWSLEG